ncbi:MAG: hypothetical protein V1944_02445 [Candidatus Aenigmatarchaeota archaeon]
MLAEITYYQINGIPLIVYLGILTLISFLFTASISVLNKRRINKIPFKWHSRMAAISIILTIIHGSLGILAYL